MVERLTNGKTYRVKYNVYGNEKQVNREQQGVINTPTMHEKGSKKWIKVLLRFKRVNSKEPVLDFREKVLEKKCG